MSGEFDQAIADEICDRLAKGESLRKICGSERDDFMPGQTTVFRWLGENEEFAKQYARAREAQADSKFEEAWEIAESATAESVQVARLKVDTIKWQTAKLAPKKYGEAVQLKHADADGEKIALDEVATVTRLSAIVAKIQGRADAADDAS